MYYPHPELLRCSHCYRTFQPEIATKHVEHCSRKASEKDGYVPNSLGQTVVSGCSPTLIRTRQYVNTVLQRTVSNRNGAGSNSKTKHFTERQAPNSNGTKSAQSYYPVRQ
ncbi:hypothetical protein EG68_07489 [Paragonimus skrjabini miyazakii]|uniref:Uncharacterized protein n=1 Tax=Paragonimus skrjabini miyazakii TaxID=59628 RepID=A0A8S9YL21_9TREM|nr:hypothetical protein EG68_07489 [Paragonimus skrjabini miyazakii]